MNRGDRLARRWPWRNTQGLACAFDVDVEMLDHAKFDLLADLTAKAKAEVEEAAASKRWLLAFPFPEPTTEVDRESGFARGIVVVKAWTMRRKPCWPWSPGATWVGKGA